MQLRQLNVDNWNANSRNVTLAVVDSIKERCLQWIGRDCWRMRLEDNMNPTIFMY